MLFGSPEAQQDLKGLCSRVLVATHTTSYASPRVTVLCMLGQALLD